MITSKLGGRPWHAVTLDSSGDYVLGVFPLVERARWYASMCDTLVGGLAKIRTVHVDVQTTCLDGPMRWVHTSKCDPADVDALKARLEYAEKLLARIAGMDAPRIHDGQKQHNLDMTYAAVRKHIARYSE